MMSDYANTPAEARDRPKPEVGGFLLYLCIALTLLGPAKMLQVITQSSTGLITAIYTTLTVTSIIAGITIWTVARFAFIWLRIHLAARLLYAIFQVWIAFRISDRRGDPAQEIVAAATNLAILLLLFLYFRLSSRVNATFGRNL